MNVLLDTHVLIWWIENNRRLGKRAKAIIQSDQTTVWVSAASVWEISIKAAQNRFDIKRSFVERFGEEINKSGFRRLPVDFDHAFAVRELPLHHADPFDRMLVAQAQCEGLTLITADERMEPYEVPTLDAST
jgi:PIN domain nuclease of toxin-antitoxin system